MRIFSVLDTVHVPNRWHLGVISGPDGVIVPLFSGVRVVAEGVQVAETHPGIPMEFCLTSFGVPIATHRLVAAMSEADVDHIQEIPLVIQGRTGYSAINVLRVVDCVDVQRSDFLIIDHPSQPSRFGDYKYFNRLVLRKASIPADAHIFRLPRYLGDFLVSERLKAVMEAEGCFGAVFTEVQLG